MLCVCRRHGLPLDVDGAALRVRLLQRTGAFAKPKSLGETTVKLAVLRDFGGEEMRHWHSLAAPVNKRHSKQHRSEEQVELDLSLQPR